LLWIALGALVIVICMVFVVGSIVMFGVLREISDARNYDSAAAQFAGYEEFFKSAAEAGFKVDSDKPNIKEGITQYLWTVTPPNDGPMRVFSWQHDLETNEVRPTSNAAALLDIELGRIDMAKAQGYAVVEGRQVFQFDPDDKTANAIIDRNASAFARNSADGWGPQQPQLANAPPLPPALFDTKARSRKGVGSSVASAEEDAEEEATNEENPTEGDGEQVEGEPPAASEPEPEEPEPPTEVQPEPPADDGGDGNDDAGGGDPEPEPPGDGEGDGDGEATPVG